MTLVARDAAAYVPTSADVLWLRRAVEAEGAPRAGVARALVNLFMLQRSRGSTQTLTQLVRAYAQPVNPAWFTNGAKYLSATRTPAERARAEARERVHSTRTTFSADTQSAVAAALKAPFPVDVTDYAAADVDASDKYEARTPARAGENRFWSRAPGWPGYSVDGAGGAALGPLVVVMVLGFLVLRGRR